MDLQPHPVAETMTEVRAVPSVDDDAARCFIYVG